MRKNLILVAIFLSLPFRPTLLAQGPGGPPPMDAAQKKLAVEGLNALLIDNYVFPEVAKETAKHLSERLASGAYDGAADAAAFSRALTQDLQAIAKDRHLGVMPQQPGEKPVSDESPEGKARMERELRPENYGFKRVEILAGNIGYLDLRIFPPPQFAGDTAVAAMTFLGRCDALVFDLRKNGGGDPAMVQLLSTYLFDEPTHLNDLYWRKGERRDQFWTLPYAPGSRLSKIPVYVLTSPQTFSGAEEFANNLKVLKRATIVGETTGGGANPGDRFFFDPMMAVFIPTGRAINPTTGTNWEGSGVEPDIKVPAEQALAEAQIGALKTLMAKAQAPEEQAPYEWALQAVEASKNPAHFTPSELEAFAGNYGPRKVWIEKGKLVQQRQGRPRVVLLPFAGTTFAAEGNDQVRFTFVLDGRGKVSKLILEYANGMRDESARDR